MAQFHRNLALKTRLMGLLNDPDAHLAAAARQWAAITAFYAALHWVEATLYRRWSIDSHNHAERWQHLYRFWPYARTALHAYDHLRNLADRARYHCWIPSDANLSDVDTDLLAVQQGIR